jgi:hypothetical protein
MKSRISALLLLVVSCLTWLVLPAAAGIVYDNGPINGQTDAWTINYGFAVADSFTISGGNTTLNGLSIGAWLTPGDTLQSVEVLITSQPLGGTLYFDGIVDFTQSGCYLNSYNYDVCTETGSFNGPRLANGDYWLGLQNAVDTDGDPVYWDENSGVGCNSPGCPSEGSSGGFGTLPSESFTLLGTTNGSSTPEPSTLALVASGAVGLVSFVRRKLF